jgi:hypothetical protein
MRTISALSGNHVDTCLFVHYHNYVHGMVQSTLNSAKKIAVFNEAYAVLGHGAFWLVLSYRPFGTTYRSHLQG